MIQKKSDIDTLIYLLMVFLTFGGVWVIRIIITHAIRCAFKEVKK